MIGQPAQFTRLTDAMKQQGYKPDVLMFDPSAYDPDYVEGGGEGAEGTTVFMNFVPFEEAARNKETQLYLSWLRQVKPGAQPTFFGVFSWSAARLFAERAAALGGDLSRRSLVASLRKVDDWTANGLHAPQRPGPKRTGECFRFVKLREGRWVPEDGTRYHCNGTTVTADRADCIPASSPRTTRVGTVRLDIQLDARPDHVVERARELASTGVDGLFTFEGPHDVFLPLTLAAPVVQTDLMTNVAIAIPRSPMHLAHTAYDLQLLSQGRFRLGLGSQIQPHIEKRYGATWSRPAARMRETVLAVKAILTSAGRTAPGSTSAVSSPSTR